MLTGRGSLKKRIRRFVLLAMLGTGIGLAWFLGILRAPNPKLGIKLKPAAHIDHPEVAEASGLVQSATHGERFWLHNDSGDVPRIFAMTLEGEILIPPKQAARGMVTRTPGEGERLYQGISVTNARLEDWEDIARHEDHLYIAEMGNNLNKSRHLGVYEIVEPNPKEAESVKAQAFLPIVYPDQHGYPPTGPWNFDCEAVFWWGEHLYFVTKTRPAFRVYVQGTEAGLYRLDSQHRDKDNVLTKVDHAKDLGGWVTAADASQDGRYIAILIESPVQSVWLYERPVRGDQFFTNAASVKRLVFHDAGQLESLAFFRHPDGQDEIVILNEQRDVFRLSLDLFQPVR